MTFDEQLRRGFETLTAHLHDEISRKTQLVTAIRQIDNAGSLSEILDTLLSAAAVEVDRVALLLVRGAGYTAWRSIGFTPPFERGELVELTAGASVIPLDIGGQTVAVLHVE